MLVFDLRQWVPNPLHQKEEKVQQYVDGSHEQTVLGVFSNEAFAGVITNITNDCIGIRDVVRFLIVFGTSAVYRADTSGRTLKWSVNSVTVDGEPMFQAQHFPLCDMSEKDDVEYMFEAANPWVDERWDVVDGQPPPFYREWCGQRPAALDTFHVIEDFIATFNQNTPVEDSQAYEQVTDIDTYDEEPLVPRCPKKAPRGLRVRQLLQAYGDGAGTADDDRSDDDDRRGWRPRPRAVPTRGTAGMADAKRRQHGMKVVPPRKVARTDDDRSPTDVEHDRLMGEATITYAHVKYNHDPNMPLDRPSCVKYGFKVRCGLQFQVSKSDVVLTVKIVCIVLIRC